MAPNFHPGQGDFSKLDGALNWMAWPNDGRNKAPEGGVVISVIDGDDSYRSTIGDKSLISRTFRIANDSKSVADSCFLI